jgi:hypothetical protein
VNLLQYLEEASHGCSQESDWQITFTQGLFQMLMVYIKPKKFFGGIIRG